MLVFWSRVSVADWVVKPLLLGEFEFGGAGFRPMTQYQRMQAVLDNALCGAARCR